MKDQTISCENIYNNFLKGMNNANSKFTFNCLNKKNCSLIFMMLLQTCKNKKNIDCNKMSTFFYNNCV